MPDDIRSLLATSVDAIRLKILVFGPQLHTPSSDVRIAKLQNKRREIRQKLEDLDHIVKYAEDLVDPHLPGPSGNKFFQELVIMNEYDLIVTLVESYGSIVEMTAISMKRNFALKSALFLDGDHIGGLAGEACLHAEMMGAYFKTYAYPSDLDECHLFGFIAHRVAAIQMMKYML